MPLPRLSGALRVADSRAFVHALIYICACTNAQKSFRGSEGQSHVVGSMYLAVDFKEKAVLIPFSIILRYLLMMAQNYEEAVGRRRRVRVPVDVVVDVRIGMVNNH